MCEQKDVTEHEGEKNREHWQYLVSSSLLITKLLLLVSVE